MNGPFEFQPDSPPSVAIDGSLKRFPVHRIYCVGRNYAAHAREMGADPEREPPFFFMKPADTITASGEAIPYPPRTRNFHHEIELVVAMGVGGANIATPKALEHVFGYAVGNDLTRRDLQFQSRDKGRPWDTGKSFEHAAVIAPIVPAARSGHPSAARIWLSVNGVKRQESNIDQMIWSVPEIIAELSTLFTLRPGDLIYTGTPEGVGPLTVGDSVAGGIDGFGQLTHRIVEARL